MGMLSRYQRPGGFIQLLQLIETCGKPKQNNFLQIIEKEDPKWAQAVQEKILTIDKIFSWDTTVIGEIAGRLQKLTLAVAMHGLKPEDCERLLSSFSHSQKRNIEDLRQSNNPSASEINSAFLKILVEVRSMITQGYIRLEKFAPELVILEGIEERLGSSPQKFIETAAAAPTQPPPAQTPVAKGKNDSDIQALRTHIKALAQENQQLRAELQTLRNKLAQIKKVA